MCVSISLSISVLRAGSEVSVGFLCLTVFLLVILSLMFCGSSLCLECCFPLGMLCLSAFSIMFVRMVLDWWMFWGGSMLVSASSISWVKSCQFALW